jgi:predicted permease
MGWLRRLVRVFRQTEDDRKVAAEFNLHVELETEDLVRQGLTRAEARRRALVAFGGIERLREQARDSRGIEWLRSFAQDLRYARRSLSRTPWYTVTVISVLTLSTTLATTVFAVVDGVLLKPLPYPRAVEIVSIEPGWRSLPPGGGTVTASSSDLLAWMAAAPEVTFAFFEVLRSEQIDEGWPARSATVSSSFFDVFGQSPFIGGFQPGQFSTARPVRPALLTHACWKQRFGGDPTILGRTLHGDRGQAIEVVGILPESFLFPAADGRFVPEVLTPLILPADAATSRGRGLVVAARLPSSLSLETFTAKLAAATVDVARQFPVRADDPAVPANARFAPFDIVRVRPIDDALRAQSGRILSLVLATALALMLVACLNVMGLAAARAQDRQRELVLRRAIGATTMRLARLLAVENLFILGIGGALGIGVSSALIGVVATYLPREMALLKPLAVDGRVMGFVLSTLGVSVVLTSIWPARVVLDVRPNRVLSEAARSTVRRRSFGRVAVIAAQVALAMVMALAGALLTVSLFRLWREDPGYRVDRTVHLWIFPRAQTSSAQISDLVEDLARLPGVRAAGGSNRPLLQRAYRGNSFDSPPEAVERAGVESFGITAGFFEATSVRPIAGRWPTDAELLSGAPVVVVSETVARQYWSGRAVVGQTLVSRRRPFSVIGVVGDARYLALDTAPGGAIYYPVTADPEPWLTTVFIAFEGSPDLSAVRSLIATRHPVFRVRSVQSVSATLGDSVRNRSFQTLLFASFGLSAVGIVAVGILGLAAVVTSRRTREIGVRLALGARPSSIRRLVLREELTSVACGLGIGALVSAWSARLVGGYLYQTDVYDPTVWTAVVVLLSGTAAAGILIPAVRASRINPVEALRLD